ncbi:DUF47 domain-containing protein [Carboxydothermus pertinax]|uniref:Phosphate transport regulator n=1 Tax=Carboxydothermus pertinax TaxID=870242 RepID=A0A1L8CTL4_9THEO|nr:DUF47 family protein [Carboxydothermus pertinax]GAV22253.1 hypothetical protein cpu_07630 [Carboxydothermus pertinax]
MISLKPKKPIFFELFSQSAKYVVDGAEVLVRAVNSPYSAQENLQDLKAIESRGDEVTRNLLDKLDKSFSTPMDREDIMKIAANLDDILDFIYATYLKMVLYDAINPTQTALKMVEVIKKVAHQVYDAVKLLDNVPAHHEKLIELCMEINRLESVGDEIFQEGTSYLFKNVHDPIELIKWKEIYEHIEELLDLCEDLGDLIKGVVLKYA